jgi:prolycopene isomerase
METRKKPLLNRDYDVVIIGAGNGGLTAGCTLAAAGVKTVILEKNNLPGGYATSFVRGRFEFEAALHAMADQIGRASCRERVCQYV